MLAKINQISVRQLLCIYIIIVLSPLIRLVPSYAAEYGKQAAWLSPLVSLLPTLIVIYILDSIFKRYKTESMAQIFEDIMSKPVGMFIVFLYFLWSTVLTALYMRYDVERLTGSIYPNINFIFFIIFTLSQIAYALRTDLTVIARMSEVIMPIIFILFGFLVLLLLPMIRHDTILPISYTDIIPIIKASRGSSGIYLYYFLLFFLSDKLSHKQKLKKQSILTIIILVVSTTIMLIAIIGLMGSSVVRRTPIPFLVAVKQISIINTIQNIESVAVAMWILADFILIAALIIVSLNIAKTLFNLKDIKPLQNIYILLIYILTLGIANNKLELETFSQYIMIPINLIFGLLIPMVLFATGKIRKKI
jgi:spore germination protein KB